MLLTVFLASGDPSTVKYHLDAGTVCTDELAIEYLYLTARLQPPGVGIQSRFLLDCFEIEPIEPGPTLPHPGNPNAEPEPDEIPEGLTAHPGETEA